MTNLGRAINALRTSLQMRPASIPLKAPPVVQDTKQFDEEKLQGYDPRSFYPAQIGEILGQRYEIAAKLGYGAYFTVWLARDRLRWFWQPELYVALKINVNDGELQETVARELEAGQRILQGSRRHQGRKMLRNALDSFTVKGPHGDHLCLTFEALREPLWLLRRRGADGRLPLSLLKPMVHFFLLGLDYLHSECQTVHTDLKTDNLLIAFENSSVVDDFVRAERDNPNPVKIVQGRTLYLSRDDFGPPRGTIGEPKICDFGQARFIENGRPQYDTIQPSAYRAPEVILGAGWTFSADLWNLGVMLWDLVEKESLFSPSHARGVDTYSADLHLAQMISLMGKPPAELLARSRDASRYFDTEGHLLAPGLIPEKRDLAQTLPSLHDELEEDMFVDFVSRLLTWCPEERSTASQSLEHPWIKAQ